MIKKALSSAFDILFSEKTNVTKLFEKPFSNSDPSPGYIQRYCAGVRENGGQYTHAAVWFALALLKFGKAMSDEELIEMGLKIYESIDPSKNIAFHRFENYQREPYVLCGDVYDAKDFRGHGGWSWYTGAASWFVKLQEEAKK
jgi:cyclic beta-1,2-glucan synthetase